MEHKSKVRTCFWISSGGLEMARRYVSIVPGSEIDAVLPHGRPDDPMVVEFTLAGAPMMILTASGGPELSAAASISILTEDQAETDRLWMAITDGGEEGRCGWAVDRYGVSWQVVPKRMPALLAADDPEAARRVMEAMMTMRKIDIAAIERAAAGA